MCRIYIYIYDLVSVYIGMNQSVCKIAHPCLSPRSQKPNQTTTTPLQPQTRRREARPEEPQRGAILRLRRRRRGPEIPRHRRAQTRFFRFRCSTRTSVFAIPLAEYYFKRDCLHGLFFAAPDDGPWAGRVPPGTRRQCVYVAAEIEASGDAV